MSQELVEARQRTRLSIAVEALSASTFRVCEDCGGPAMLHPKFEMAQIVAGEKTVLCCGCLHDLVCPEQRAVTRMPGERRVGDQLWQCLQCLSVRVWGYMQPETRHQRPLLGCVGCHHSSRHQFLTVA